MDKPAMPLLKVSQKQFSTTRDASIPIFDVRHYATDVMRMKLLHVLHFGAEFRLRETKSGEHQP
jgi:hypothetical protein